VCIAKLNLLILHIGTGTLIGKLCLVWQQALFAKVCDCSFGII